jgi:replicative DNA helicase
MGLNTEQALLGAMMRDNSLVHAYPCQPEEFADVKNGELYRTIRGLVDGGEPADAVTLLDQLPANFRVDNLMGDYVGAPENAGAYYRTFKRTARLRRAQEVGERIRSATTPEDVESCCAALIAACEPEESHQATRQEMLTRVLDELDALQKGKQPGIYTGMAPLDAKLGGLHAGDLVVLAARSQHGKTAMMLNMANAMECPIGIVSGEQPNLFVDYLQLVTGGEGDQHRLQVGNVARRLKAVAKSLGITVVVLAQVGRAVDAKPGGSQLMGRMPWTADLADSAQIEDAADQIITLYRPEVYWPNEPRAMGKAFLNICKNRHGPTNVLCMAWEGETMRFRVAA